MNYNLSRFLLTFLFLLSIRCVSSQCTGLTADAGPDMISCDSSQMIQLQGSIQGNYTKFFWTPTTGLSDPNSLTPMVTYKGKGKYTYKITAEGLSTTNLIVNGNFESGNSGFTSGYNYTSKNITEGEYFITGTPQTWNGGFSPCGDHTNGSGNMLLLNGHPVAGTNCWCQNVPTVAGKIYQFEFWSQSVVASNIAQLSVKINGVTVGSTQAGGLCNWELYTITFTASGASTLICISESTGIRSGNDFALDDIAMYEKCISMDDVTVEIINLTAKLDIIKKPRCSSDLFDLTALGSSTGPEIKYAWSTDVGKFIFTNGLNARAVGSGTYIVKVIYTNGSVSCEKEASIEVMAPEVLTGTIQGNGKVNCSKDSIRLLADIFNGNGTYSYKWLPDSLILSGRNTNEAKVNTAFKYSVVITDLISGCVLNLAYDLGADTLHPNASITGDSLLDCRKNKARLTSSVRDSLLYNIQWTNPHNDTAKGVTSIEDSLQGNYKLIIEDLRNHCKDSSDKFIDLDTSQPVVDLGPDVILTCKMDSTILLNKLNNPAGNYSFTWIINGNKQATDSVLIPKIFKTSAKLGLEIVNRKNGCKNFDSLNIILDQQGPSIDAGSSEILNCSRKNIVLQSLFFLTDSFKVHWNSPSGNILSNPDSSKITVNKKAWYFISLTNLKNGCSNLDSVFVDENLIKPNAPVIPDQNFSCKDSLVTIDGSTASNGPNILYNWSTNNGSIKSGQNSNTIIVSNAGTYLFIVIDTSNGCSDTSLINVWPDLNKPIIQIAVPDTLTCKKTIVDLTGLISSPKNNPLTFQWKDQNGNLIGSKDSTIVIVGTPGNYILEATDLINGCSNQATITVTIDTLQPIIDLGKDKIWNCASRSIHLNSNYSGVQNPSYQWTTQNGQITGPVNQKEIDLVSPGRYYCLIVNTSNGCSAVDSVDILPDLQKPTIQLELPDTLDCKTNLVQLINLNGSNRYSYGWSTFQGQINGQSNQLSAMVSKSGKYYLRVVDTFNLCESLDSLTVLEDYQKPGISIIPPNQFTCKINLIDIVAVIDKNIKNYSVLWTTSNGRIVNADTSNPLRIDKTGKYYLIITNSDNGCFSTDSVLVTENKNIPLDIYWSINQPKCPDDDGIIIVDSVSGGESPVQYELDDVQFQAGKSIVTTSGLHKVKVTDKNGCTLVKTFSVDVPKSISVSISPSVKINEGSTYLLQPTFSLPKDSIAWIKWEPANNLSCTDCPNPIVSGLTQSTTYTVSYSDLNGCIASAIIEINIIKRGIWLPNTFSPNGDNLNDYFYPVAIDESYKEIKFMAIYDRWGNQVFYKTNFQPNNPLNGWNGYFKNHPMNPGVFTYVVEIKWNDDSTERLYGDVTISR